MARCEAFFRVPSQDRRTELSGVLDCGGRLRVYRASNETHSLETRVTVLEQASHDSASRVEQLTADRRKLCTTVDRVRQKITGVILTPGSPPPNFDVEADPLSAPDRIILALYNWCQAVP